MKILVADKLSTEALDALKKVEDQFETIVKVGLSEDELAEAAADVEGLIVRSGAKVTRKVIEASNNLKVIGRAGVGVDNVDLDAATEKGVVVMNTPGGNTIAAAEQTFALLLAMMRNIPQAYVSMKAGKWERSNFVGNELEGKTIGIIGLGRIGMNVARYARGFKMRILGNDPFISKENAEKADIELMEMDELLAQSDIISLHAPATEKTRGMVNKEFLAKMKNGSRLVNCARGALIVEADLIEALKNGPLKAAALDVFVDEPTKNEELVALDNVIVAPHLGASTREAQIEVGIQIVRQVTDALSQQIYDNAVNMAASDPAILERFSGFLSLAEKIGIFLSKLLDGGIKEVRVGVSGECSEAIEPLNLAFLKGLLSPITGGNVNFVNAQYLARQRGIRSETMVTDSGDYTNLISCKVITDKEEGVVFGTVFGHELPRIVQINEFFMDVDPSGNMLVLKNTDLPGVIGHVGTTLGDAGINIAEYRLGREEKRKNTLSIIRVDSVVPDDVLKKIAAIEGMQMVKQVSMQEF